MSYDQNARRRAELNRRAEAKATDDRTVEIVLGFLDALKNRLTERIERCSSAEAVQTLEIVCEEIDGITSSYVELEDE